jgi:hypothetical protein
MARDKLIGRVGYHILNDREVPERVEETVPYQDWRAA